LANEVDEPEARFALSISQTFSENLRKKLGAKRESYAASQIFSQNLRNSQRNKKCETRLL